MTTFGSTVLEVASAAGLLALPILVYRAVTNLVHHAASPEVYQVPIITILSRLAGILWAGLALTGGLGERAFRLSEIFIPQSMWEIPVTEFLISRGNLWSYPMGDILAWATTGDQPWALASVAVMGFAAVGAVVLCSRMFSRPHHRFQALLICSMTMVLFAWQSVYLVTLALWLIHRANFWSLAIIALYIQYRRSRHP